MTYEKTVNTIESVLRYTNHIDYEIILLDNGSKNDDAEKLEKYAKKYPDKIYYIKNKENSGFSKGNNIAFEKAKGEYIIFLNSDTELTDNSLYKGLIYKKNNKKIGALGTRLVTPDGKLDHGCKRGFPTPSASLYYFLKLNKLFKNQSKHDTYKLSYLDEYKINDVDVISGAFFMSPKKVLNEVGVFDEQFFMYGEDIDLCYRIKEKGYKVVYNPEIGTVIHYKGASGKKRRFKTIYHFYHSMIIFYNKHYRKKYNVLVTGTIYLAVGALFLIKIINNILKQK